MMSDEDKPCEFCNGDGCKTDGFGEEFGEGVDIYLEGVADGNPRIGATGWSDGGCCCGVGSVEIKFCPICGRRLV